MPDPSPSSSWDCSPQRSWHGVVRGSSGRRARVPSTRRRWTAAGRPRHRRPPVLSFSLASVCGLAAAGYVIATQAARAQDYGGFVQFWSTPAAPGRPAEVGIGNQTRDVLACAIEITRPAHGGASVLIDAIQPGQPRLAALPAADASETEPWQLDPQVHRVPPSRSSAASSSTRRTRQARDTAAARHRLVSAADRWRGPPDPDDRAGHAGCRRRGDRRHVMAARTAGTRGRRRRRRARASDPSPRACHGCRATPGGSITRPFPTR